VQNAKISQPVPNVRDRSHRIRFGTDHGRTQFLLRMRYRNLLWHMFKAFVSGFAAQCKHLIIALPVPNVRDRSHRIRFGTDHSRTQFLLRMRYRNLRFGTIEFDLAPITVELNSYCACAIGIYSGQTNSDPGPLCTYHQAHNPLFM